MWTSFLNWAVVAIPTVLGLLGLLVPVGEYLRRHRTISVFVGIVLSGMIYLQQHLARVAANDARTEDKRELTGLLQSSHQREEYMRGQLDSLILMVGTFGEKKDDAALKDLARALTKLSDKQQDKSGKTLVPPRAEQITIVHGFNDPQHDVIIIPVANWATHLMLLKQDARSVTYMFNVQAPLKDGVVVWRASKPN